jgi:hypothetical protein
MWPGMGHELTVPGLVLQWITQQENKNATSSIKAREQKIRATQDKLRRTEGVPGSIRPKLSRSTPLHHHNLTLPPPTASTFCPSAILNLDYSGRTWTILVGHRGGRFWVLPPPNKASNEQPHSLQEAQTSPPTH